MLQNQDITLVHLPIRITGHALRLFRCLLGFILHIKRQSLNLIQARQESKIYLTYTS